jgi:hypothetical protein
VDVADLLETMTARLTTLAARVDELERQERGISGTVNATWKSHRVATFTFSSANVWTDIPFDLRIDDESTLQYINWYDADGPGEDTSIIVISGLNDVFTCGGCVRPLWTGTAGTRVIVATRIVISDNAGVTWREARCLQAVNERDAQSNEVGTNHYLGTVRSPGTGETWLKLQARVANTAMQFAGWPTFDNPVAASININSVGATNYL